MGAVSSFHLYWKSKHVPNLFPFSYCQLMEISFSSYIGFKNISDLSSDASYLIFYRMTFSHCILNIFALKELLIRLRGNTQRTPNSFNKQMIVSAAAHELLFWYIKNEKWKLDSFHILGKLYDPSSTLPLHIEADVDLRDFALRTQFESNAIAVMLDLTKVAD